MLLMMTRRRLTTSPPVSGGRPSRRKGDCGREERGGSGKNPRSPKTGEALNFRSDATHARPMKADMKDCGKGEASKRNCMENIWLDRVSRSFIRCCASKLGQVNM